MENDSLRSRISRFLKGYTTCSFHSPSLYVFQIHIWMYWERSNPLNPFPTSIQLRVKGLQGVVPYNWWIYNVHNLVWEMSMWHWSNPQLGTNLSKKHRVRWVEITFSPQRMHKLSISWSGAPSSAVKASAASPTSAITSSFIVVVIVAVMWSPGAAAQTLILPVANRYRTHFPHPQGFRVLTSNPHKNPRSQEGVSKVTAQNPGISGILVFKWTPGTRQRKRETLTVKDKIRPYT